MPKTKDYSRRTEFRRKGVSFLVEESFSKTTPNNNVWILDEKKNRWVWTHLTNWDYDKLVRCLKRKGVDYFND